jgi:hypothetical protein
MPRKIPSHPCRKCGGPAARKDSLCRGCYDKEPRAVLEFKDCTTAGCNNRVTSQSRLGICRTCYQRVYSYGKARADRRVSEQHHDFSSLGEVWKMPEGKPLKFVPDYKTNTVSRRS